MTREDFSRDYLNLLLQPKITKYFDDNCIEKKIYSDMIYNYDKRGNKKRFIVMITYEALYILIPLKLDIKQKIPLAQITQIGLSENHFLMFSIHTNCNFDVLLESFKRFEIIRFMYQACDVMNVKKFPMLYNNSFDILFDSKGQIVSVDPT